jgi:hypothetical protein
MIYVTDNKEYAEKAKYLTTQDIDRVINVTRGKK